MGGLLPGATGHTGAEGRVRGRQRGRLGPEARASCLCSALTRGPVSTLPFVGFGQSQEFTALPKGQPGLKFSSKHGADS